MRKLVAVLFLFVPLTFAQTDTKAGLDRNSSITVPSPIKKQALQPFHLTSGRMRLLQQQTGLSVTEINQMYEHSGAKNFGQFTCAVLASQQLKLDRAAVLQGLYNNNLRETLKRLGVESDQARDVILDALHQIIDSEKKG
jgi:hypothetical protein